MQRESDEMNLTTYALGELEGAEREAVEARLAASSDDRRFVEEVRAAARLISDELSQEPVGSLDAIHHAAIELRLRGSEATRSADHPRRGHMGFFLSLAASIAIIGGAVGAILLAISRHNDVAVNVSQTQPAGMPILIPLDPSSSGTNDASPGVAMAPPSSDPFISVADHPVSSFAMNTDTASYDEVRDAIVHNRTPTRDSLKTEGLINAFQYDEPAVAPGAVFGVSIEVGQCPWQPEHRLARIAVKARPGVGNAAEDVHTEVAFLPATVKSYRLLGYDRDTSGSNGQGEIVAAGQAVTVLYEMIPASSATGAAQLLTLRLRYRPGSGQGEQLVQFIGRDLKSNSSLESNDFRFAAAVAEFAMVLRGSPQRGQATVQSAIALAEAGRGADRSGQRKAFIELARHAKQLMG